MTTNPWLVMAINMSVVFGVLIMIGVLMKIIHWVDPTKKKSERAEAAVAAPAPVAAPAAPAANNNEEIVAVIAAAISAMGYSSEQIASVRPKVSSGWRLDGRLSGRM